MISDLLPALKIADGHNFTSCWQTLIVGAWEIAALTSCVLSEVPTKGPELVFDSK